jgi:hypothetical protein
VMFTAAAQPASRSVASMAMTSLRMRRASEVVRHRGMRATCEHQQAVNPLICFRVATRTAVW